MSDFYRKNYEILHKNENFFWGKRTYELSPIIEKILKFYSCKSLYDFGCGKGHQYSIHKIDKIWNIENLYLYDIGVPEISKKPYANIKFDAVISIDVFEHIEENDIETEIKELIERIIKIGFFVIDTKPALKTLPDGRNAHLTIKPKKWWDEKIKDLNNENKKIIVIYDGIVEDNFETFNLSEKEKEFFKKEYYKYKLSR